MTPKLFLLLAASFSNRILAFSPFDLRTTVSCASTSTSLKATTSVIIDTTDKKYQVSKDFPPNKESSWPYPLDEDGWVHSHNAIRNELRTMRATLTAMQDRKDRLKGWQIKALSAALKCHVEHIHFHHVSEDEISAPFLKTRFNYPDKLVTDHSGLDKILTTIRHINDNFKPGDSINALLKEWITYEEYMLPHLKEEEEVAVPLMRAYFTPEEVAVMVEKIIEHSPSCEMGSFIYAMGMDKFRTKFMPQENIPPFVWDADFSAKHALFQREFVQNVMALQDGKFPMPRKAILARLFSWVNGTRVTNVPAKSMPMQI